MSKIKLSKPIDGKDEIDMDLESLTGADFELLVREASAAKNEPVLLPEFDVEFHAQAVVKLTKISRAELTKLPARDYQKMTAAVRSFFVGSE